jgi:beta-galactosidase
MAFYGDVVSWNYTENMFEYDHERFPQLMFIASETGTNLDFGTRKNSWLEMDTSYVIGHYYWSATDYLGESAWPTKVWGRALLDITDEMTPIGYLYKSFYSDEPMVHIMVYEEKSELKEWFDKMQNKRWNWYPLSDHWNWEGGKVKVQAISNADEVELYLNGKSLGKKQFTEKFQTHLDWEVPYEKGELKAVARIKGKKVAENIIKTAGEAVRIKVDPDVNVLRANGLDLAYIEVSLVDKDGITVPDADRMLNFTVEGGGILAGVANSDIFSDEPWVAPGKTTHKGKCLVVIRSTLKKGKVVLRISGEGLAGETMEIQCIPAL